MNKFSSIRSVIFKFLSGGILRLATIKGIPVQVHWTFSLLLIWIIYAGFSDGYNWQDILIYISFVLSVFLCVILHEFGHAMAAKKYGIDTHDITISPIGGVARLLNIPDVPKQELVIAFAGPLVNLVIASLIALIILVFLPEYKEYIFSIDENTFLDIVPDFLLNLLRINLILIAFNMIPAFPMDGGRILRALLATKLGRLSATFYASLLGKIVAFGFFTYGLYVQQYTLLFIAVFVFFMADYEYKYVKSQSERAVFYEDDSENYA